jgi:hypothetical protein
MKRLSWRTKFGIVLVVLTVALLYLHELAFPELSHEWGLYFATHEIAMMPLEVLVVTLILHSLLERRAHHEKMNKMHMVIGAFFSEVGGELLRRISALDETVEVREHFLVNGSWEAARYARAKAAASSYDYGIQASADDLEALKGFIVGKRQFLLALLQNPSLLEHETFTNALWAVFHMTEELEQRPSLRDLPDSDHTHLVGDIKRAYGSVAVEWLDHAQHLQRQYPYLFSLAVRTNPLDPQASVTVTG